MQDVAKVLPIVVVAISSKDINIDLVLKNTINEPVFLCYLPAPTSLRLSLQRFWMASALKGMLLEIAKAKGHKL